MTEPSLPELEAERDRLYAQLSAVGDFRRGSVSENYRKCGKPNCACAQPDHPGHGPRFLWTRSARGREAPSAGSWRPAEVEKVRREVARHAEFAAISEQIAEVNEKICEARPAAGTDAPSGAGGRKRGLCEALAREKAAEIGRLAAEAARSLGCGERGLEAAEAVIRAGMLQAGCGMLEQLLAADPGYRGPRVPCGQGHEAEFVSYRDKVIDTVLGAGDPHARLVPLRGLRARPRPARRRARRGRARPCRRACAAMNDQAAAAGPFAKAARLLENLAGVRLTAKRVERAAEASGAAAGCRRPGPGRADHRPQARAAAAVPAAGQAVRRDRRHRRARDREGDRRAGRQGRGRPRPHPRGQARRLLHPGQAR